MKRDPEHILEEWLVINAQMGSESAMDQLLQRWYPRLKRYATRQLDNVDSAADVVQSTLETVIRDVGRLRDPAAFAGWIYQILHRRGIDFIRKRSRGREVPELAASEEGIEPMADEAATPAEQVEFARLLQNLDTDMYQAVHLYYLEGFNVAEIAGIQGIAVGTVKSRLSRARQKLKTMISGVGHE